MASIFFSQHEYGLTASISIIFSSFLRFYTALIIFLSLILLIRPTTPMIVTARLRL